MRSNNRPEKLLWIDLEMTGLDPEQHRILEVGIIVTDFSFNELESFEAVLHQPEAVIRQSSEWVKHNIGEGGLFDEVRSSGLNEKNIEVQLLELVGRHFTQPAILAGNSIHQDRLFIRKYWPKLEKKLHYRMLDVTSLKILMHGKYGLEFTKNETHRALSDVSESIEELRYYLGFLRKQQIDA